MTQRDTLQQMDAAIHAAFLGAGLAFDGGYRGPNVPFTTAALDVRGYLDRGVEFYGEFGQVAGRRDQITLMLEDVTPAVGGHVDCDGLRFKLADLIDQDDSTAQYVVREVSIA